MKKLILTFAALLLPIAGLVFGIFTICGYHAPPELVKEVIWSPGLLEIAPDGAIYGNETAQKFFEKQLLSPPQNIFYGKNQWNPLILRGKRIKNFPETSLTPTMCIWSFLPAIPTHSTVTMSARGSTTL